MSNIIRPVELPDCKIINTLIDKANNKGNYDFNYVHNLDELRKRISIEVSNINILFPEYTPHDEKYHLKRLFFVADELLGDELIQSMNATELFLLSVSLYAHDWGMAVSTDEKDFILGGEKKSEFKYDLLDNEQSKFKEYCKSKNVGSKGIENSDWQEYVRLTHAFRSGKRVKAFFEKLSTGTGEFASRICEGHYLDFDIIEDHSSYPTDASVHLDIVNVKALTVYVRLIDLLDIGDDRTPYVLWKFVSPKNKFSKLEWAKHRAIQPVTFPNYQSGRYVQVEAGTEDINVYMSIMDLKRYVDEQFRGCSNILNRMNHQYHKLNIYHIDWRVAAKGFKPIQVQFEFDRSRMFEILSDEIYQSDSYVFVRELVQNAIDAIRMRVEIVEKKEMSFNGKISVEVINNKDFYIISVKDNGIGMDEYIIRNYLSIAGKSYYRSTDFQKEGLKMEPISRFGIGVLSCFMVADYMEIITHRDPYFSNSTERLKITIPSKENHFRIEQMIEQIDVGSTFKVFVSKDKLPKSKKTQKTIELKITEYLKHVTAFIPFPIYVTENEQTTVINNPNFIGKENELNNFSLSYSFPFEKAILAQNIATAKEFFEEKQINLKTDLGLKEFDGCITYLLPKKKTYDIINTGYSWPTSEIKVVDYVTEFEKENRIKWNDEWVYFRRDHIDEDNDIPVLNKRTCFSVYLDGILIHDISNPEISLTEQSTEDYGDRYHGIRDSFLCPQIIANIPKPVGMKLDLARTKIASEKKWDYPIWEALLNYLKKESKDVIENMDLSIRLLGLGRFNTFYKLPNHFILNGLIKHEEFPIPICSDSTKITYKVFSELGQTINLPPFKSENTFYNHLKNNILNKKIKNDFLKNWNGESFIMAVSSDNSEKQPASFVNMTNLLGNFIRGKYFPNKIKFISSPLGKDYPLVQEEHILFDFEIPNFREIDIEMVNFSSMNTNKKLFYINGILKNNSYAFPEVAVFPKPYQDKFMYSDEYINISNPIGEKFINICIAIIKTKSKDNYDKVSIDGLYDEIEKLPFMKFGHDYKGVKFSKITGQMQEIFNDAKKLGLILEDNTPEIKITENEFIENSILVNDDLFEFGKIGYFKKTEFKAKKWGEIISV